MYSSLVRVFRNPHSWGFAFAGTVIVFLLATMASNAMLVWQFVVLSDATISAKAKLLWYLAASITTNFSVLAMFYTIAIAILSGLNLALFAYYIRTRKGSASRDGIKSTGVGLGGLLSGLLGLGCAACGSALILPLLTLVGASGLLALFPLHGQEFGLLGASLLLLSVFLLLRRIADPLVCPVE